MSRTNCYRVNSAAWYGFCCHCIKIGSYKCVVSICNKQGFIDLHAIHVSLGVFGRETVVDYVGISCLGKEQVCSF